MRVVGRYWLDHLLKGAGSARDARTEHIPDPAEFVDDGPRVVSGRNVFTPTVLGQ